MEKQKIIEENKKAMLVNTETFVDIAESVKDADLVIEAVPEIMDLKEQVFQALDAAAPKHAILASNTSNMSFTEVASAMKRPKQVGSMHFFNLPVLMNLVEVIKEKKTSEATMQLTYDLALRMNNVPVRAAKDSIGFVHNQLSAPTQIRMKF